MGDNCEGCAFFYKYGRSQNCGPWQEVTECRRNAPTLAPGMSRWPEVSMSDWCGEFKAKKDQ